MRFLVPGGLERRDRVDNLTCGHDGAGVVRNVDVESGVHFDTRIICCRVSYHRHHVLSSFAFTYIEYQSCWMRASRDSQAAFAVAVNVAAFFLTNSCTL